MSSVDDLLGRANLSSDATGWWPRLMLEMVAELEHFSVALPDALAGVLTVAQGYWEGDASRRDDLVASKAACWTYLEDKHGDSSAIVDDEDRLIRACLCVLDPDSEDENGAKDRAEWLCEMVNAIGR